MQEINLLQTKIKDRNTASEKRNNLVITMLSIILVILALVTGGFFFLAKTNVSKTAQVDQENTDLRTKLDARKNDMSAAIAFQAQLINIRTVLAGHIYWSVFLDELAKTTYTKTEFKSFLADSNGKIHAEGQVPTYTDMGKLILALSKSDKFKTVKLLSIQPSSEQKNGFIFSMDMTASKDLFKKD